MKLYNPSRSPFALNKNNTHHSQLVIAVLVLFLILTTPMLDFYESLNLLAVADAKAYLLIAQQAPKIAQLPIFFHHAQRYVPHYLIGSISHYSGLPLETTYLFFAALLSLLIVRTYMQILRKQESTTEQILLLTALYLCNPHCFRFYWLALPMLADLMFVYGLLNIVYGLISGSTIWVLISCFFTTLARQNTLLILPGVALWITFGRLWCQKKKSAQIGTILISSLITIATYKLTSWIAHQVTDAQPNGIVIFYSLLSWFSKEIFTWTELAVHTTRVVLPYAFPLSFLFVVVRPWKFRAPAEVWSLVLMTLGICLMPFLMEPGLQLQNQSRLSAYGVPLSLIICTYFKTPQKAAKHNFFFWMAIVAACLGSIHHLYTIPSHRSAAIFASCYIATSILSSWFYRKHLRI